MGRAIIRQTSRQGAKRKAQSAKRKAPPGRRPEFTASRRKPGPMFPTHRRLTDGSLLSHGRRREALSDHLRHDEEQIGVLGLFAGGGDQRMRLAAVMRLMIEE